MRGRLVLAWRNMAESLWFAPGLIAVGFAMLAMLMIHLSGTIDRDVLLAHPRFFGADAESSRSMVATIASSIITVAGVSFSIVVLAVAQASSQYTPRVLRNFLRDRPSQVALGILVGVFFYCLIVIRTIRGGDDGLEFVPALAVLGAFALAAVAIGSLVYFLHHISTTMDAGAIVARVAEETVAVACALRPRPGDGAPEHSSGERESLIAACEWYPVVAGFSGYLQSIDEASLLRTAEACDVLVRVERAAGDFTPRGAVLASVAGRAPDAALALRINDAFVAQSFRTIHQDVAFGIRQLVDVALKALSPGVNDQTTAATSIDYLGVVLVELARRPLPGPLRRSADGRLRLILKASAFADLLGLAFDEIRRAGAGNPRILARLLAVLQEVGQSGCLPVNRAVLEAHGQRIARAAERSIEDPMDRAPVQTEHDRLRRALLA